MARLPLGRAGHRGAFLAFLAILDLAYGYSLWVTPAQLRVYDLLLPWQAWAVIWLANGLVCAGSVPLRTGRDRYAFGLSSAVFACWGLLFVRVWIADHAPRGWVSVIIWLAFSATVLVVSSWPEPPPPVPPPGEAEEET